MPCLLMHWRLWEPVHQEACYWPLKPEYSISSIRRVNILAQTYHWIEYWLLCLHSRCWRLWVWYFWYGQMTTYKKITKHKIIKKISLIKYMKARRRHGLTLSCQICQQFVSLWFGNVPWCCQISFQCRLDDKVVNNLPLWWRHNDHDSVSNHQPHECLLNRLFT